MREKVTFETTIMTTGPVANESRTIQGNISIERLLPECPTLADFLDATSIQETNDLRRRVAEHTAFIERANRNIILGEQ